MHDTLDRPSCPLCAEMYKPGQAIVRDAELFGEHYKSVHATCWEMVIEVEKNIGLWSAYFLTNSQPVKDSRGEG